MILETVVVGPFASNCYIVGSVSGKEGIIIDPGDEAGKILEKVGSLGLDIKLIVLTHGHMDHAGALKAVREATGVEVAMHTDDAKTLRSHSLAMAFGLFYPNPSPPDRFLRDGDVLDVGDVHFEVVHTPGHTPGGICLLGQGVVFSGDTLFNYGIGRTDLPGGSHHQLLESIRTRLLVLPDDTIVYPGHGSATTIGAERKGNPFLDG
jgi:glyoxylase-like metal-dependent hydrolase (beta-lactamase superfamily II)